MPKRVALTFHGSIVVDIDADPEDDTAWTDALAQAWADADPRDIAEAADADGHEVLDEEAGDAV